MFACLRSLTRALSIPGPVSLPSYSLRLFSAPVETGGYKSVLKSLRKQLGQHLLKHPDVVKKIVDSAAIAPTEFVLEIGPGTGNMTVHLLQQARAVLAVELDERMYEAVMTRVHALGLQQKFFCVRGDFLRMNLPPGIDVCVANIPYQISSPVVEKLLAYRPMLRRAVIMFQAEFADRMVAKPGSQTYCRLSVNTQLLASVRPLMKVKRTQFRPPPKVDSVVVEIVPKEQKEIPEAQLPDWESFLKVCFTGKNKTMRSLFTLKTVLARTKPPDALIAPDVWKETVVALLDRAGLTTARANAMTLQQFLTLYRAFVAAGTRFRSFDPTAVQSDDNDAE